MASVRGCVPPVARLPRSVILIRHVPPPPFLSPQHRTTHSPSIDAAGACHGCVAKWANSVPVTICRFSSYFLRVPFLPRSA